MNQHGQLVQCARGSDTPSFDPNVTKPNLSVLSRSYGSTEFVYWNLTEIGQVTNT